MEQRPDARRRSGRLHDSRQMLEHYSDVRMEAKREAIDAVWKKRAERGGAASGMTAPIAHHRGRMRPILKGSPYKNPYTQRSQPISKGRRLSGSR